MTTNRFDVTVKRVHNARAIGQALNKNKPGSGDYYMDGYMARLYTEKAARKAVRESYDTII